LTWGFESNTTEGWQTDTTWGGGVTNVIVSSSEHHTGSYSLAVVMGLGSYSISGQQNGASVLVAICKPGGTVNLAGYTFSAWVKFTVRQGAVTQYRANLVQAYLEDSGAARATTYGDSPNQVAVSSTNLNTWLHVKGVVSQPSTANDVVGLSVGFTFADYSSEGIDGTMYIDDIQLTP
jgi:hypothetical protein